MKLVPIVSTAASSSSPSSLSKAWASVQTVARVILGSHRSYHFSSLFTIPAFRPIGNWARNMLSSSWSSAGAPARHLEFVSLRRRMKAQTLSSTSCLHLNNVALLQPAAACYHSCNFSSVSCWLMANNKSSRANPL